MAEQSPPPDDADDFSGVPDPAPRRSPLLAAVVVLLAGAVLWHLRLDLIYAFRSRTPEALGDARSFADRKISLADDTYVELSGQPDRRNSLFIEARGDKSRQSFFRLLGTSSRVLVRSDTTGRTDIEDRWRGRLRRFDLLGYAPSMRKYFGEEVKAARYLSTDALVQAIAHKASSANDRTGEPVALLPDTLIDLDVAFPDELAALASHEKYASLADAKHEVERAGLTVTGGVDTPDEYRVYVKAAGGDAGRNAAIAKLEAGDFGFALHDERIGAPFSTLAVDNDKLTAGSRSFARAQVKAASVDAPIVIPADAFVVADGEVPGDFWWAPLVALLLVAFVAFNVWYLLRSRDSRTRHAAS